uniref:Parvalbumin n=1 Tax=Neolamprologus brichardi TaxID=32507 RepID=A0A3Q4HWB4_NEOBR
MSLTSILSADDIQNAIKDCEAPDTFCYKKFFKLCGLSSKTPKEVKDVFQILDEDNSGYIEHSELKFFLQRFIPSARTLTDAETKSFISAADDDSDGKIGVEGWYLVSHRKISMWAEMILLVGLRLSWWK